MGIFSFLLKPNPSQVAQKISLMALSQDVTPSERAAADVLAVDISRLVSERIQLMVGISEATIAYSHRESSRPEFREALLALQRIYLLHFERLPGLDPEIGRQVYERARARYIMRMPTELALIFNDQLESPSHWDRAPEIDYLPQGIPQQAVALADEYTKLIAHFTFDCCMPLVGK